MKKCPNCGRLYSDFVSSCSNCGTSLGGGASNSSAASPASRAAAPQPTTSRTPQYAAPQKPQHTPPAAPQYTAPQPIASQPFTSQAAVPLNGSMGKGVIGAALFSLGGGVCQAVLLNVGFVAAISGVIALVLALRGYKKFSGCGENYSKIVVVLCAVISLVMLYAGHYVGYVIALQNVLKADAGMAFSFSEVMELLKESPEEMENLYATFGKSIMLWFIWAVVSLLGKKKK